MIYYSIRLKGRQWFLDMNIHPEKYKYYIGDASTLTTVINEQEEQEEFRIPAMIAFFQKLIFLS